MVSNILFHVLHYAQLPYIHNYKFKTLLNTFWYRGCLSYTMIMMIQKQMIVSSHIAHVTERSEYLIKNQAGVFHI